MCFDFEGATDFVSVMVNIHLKLFTTMTSNESVWWKINGDKKPQKMKFLSRQTFACRENVSVWTERQTDKIIGNDTFRNARKRYRVHIVLVYVLDRRFEIRVRVLTNF